MSNVAMETWYYKSLVSYGFSETSGPQQPDMAVRRWAFFMSTPEQINE
jgi:hypothetical protein